MMEYGYGGGGGWMWVFGGLMMIGLIVLIGVATYAFITMNKHTHHSHAVADGPANPDPGGRVRIRQLLDERYARGELTTEEYTERLRTLGL